MPAKQPKQKQAKPTKTVTPEAQQAQGGTPHPITIAEPLQAALRAIVSLDIPAKGRIAHHIRTGRLDQAIELCASGRRFLWGLIHRSARGIAIMEQLEKLKQLEQTLRSYAGHGRAVLS